MIVATAIAALSMQADRPTSALEIALVERACDVLVVSRAIQAADHGKCVDDQLASLRADLGANLGRLSARDRQQLDRACSQLAGAVTREAYLDCINGQLAPLRERLRRATPAAADPVVPATEIAPTAVAPIAPAPPAAAATRWRPVAIAGGAFAILAAAAGAAVAMKKRSPPVAAACTACGTPVASAGTLCADCRRQAADALRRAAAERAAEEENAARRQKEAAEAAAQQESLRREQAAQAALAEEARQQEAEEAARQRELAARQLHTTPGAEAEASFDPHAILGVAKDASSDAIRAAYDEARAKYDPEHVSHLSPEVQQHYRDKAEAVERAFRMLA